MRIIIHEIKIMQPWNTQINDERINAFSKKHREKLLEKYLFSSESAAIPKLDIHNLSTEECREIDNVAGFYYKRCQFTMSKEKDTDQIRPINFEIVIENPNYKNSVSGNADKST